MAKVKKGISTSQGPASTKKTAAGAKPPPARKSGEKAGPDPGKNSRFIRESLLGSGGICEVHAALDLYRVEWGDTAPRVAIKRLRPEFNDNAQARLALAQEFCALRHLAHPGVVRVFDLHKEPFGICFSMEFLEGHTVQDELHKQPTGIAGSPQAFARGLFAILHFLHTCGVVHGDIKPSNVFLAPEGRIVLIDFNVATVTAQTGAACSPIARGLRESLHLKSYSLCYAGPERLQGECQSTADDVFSACCTLYEATTGVHPFGRLTSLEAKQQGRVPAKHPFFTPAQWSVLLRGLSFEPGERPDATELLDCFTSGNLLRGIAGKLRSLLP